MLTSQDSLGRVSTPPPEFTVDLTNLVSQAIASGVEDLCVVLRGVSGSSANVVSVTNAQLLNSGNVVSLYGSGSGYTPDMLAEFANNISMRWVWDTLVGLTEDAGYFAEMGLSIDFLYKHYVDEPLVNLVNALAQAGEHSASVLGTLIGSISTNLVLSLMIALLGAVATAGAGGELVGLAKNAVRLQEILKSIRGGYALPKGLAKSVKALLKNECIARKMQLILKDSRFGALGDSVKHRYNNLTQWIRKAISRARQFSPFRRRRNYDLIKQVNPLRGTSSPRSVGKSDTVFLNAIMVVYGETKENTLCLDGQIQE
jgi:hypothetical protein